jgi:hypothetical protein
VGHRGACDLEGNDAVHWDLLRCAVLCEHHTACWHQGLILHACPAACLYFVSFLRLAWT